MRALVYWLRAGAMFVKVIALEPCSAGTIERMHGCLNDKCWSFSKELWDTWSSHASVLHGTRPLLLFESVLLQMGICHMPSS